MTKEKFLNIANKPLRLLHYFSVDPNFTYKYLGNYFNKDYSSQVLKISDSEFEDLLQQGKSVIRLGDGEIHIANHGYLGQQEYSKKITEGIKDIIKFTWSKEYESGESGLILCIPHRYIEMTNEKIRENGLMRCWLPFRIYYRMYFNKKARYYDAHVFYENGSFKKYILPQLEGQNVLFVTNEKNVKLLKNNEDKFKFNAYYFAVPEKDSFSMYEDVKQRVLSFSKQYPNIKVVLAMGTPSKLLAFDLSSNNNICCYDTGFGIQYIFDNNKLQDQLKLK